mgnify:FL=1
MTTLSQTWGYTCRVCDVVTSAIVGFFISFHKSMLISRQIETNMKLCKLLKHEYPGLTEDEILNELNYKTIQRSYNDR